MLKQVLYFVERFRFTIYCNVITCVALVIIANVSGFIGDILKSVKSCQWYLALFTERVLSSIPVHASNKSFAVVKPIKGQQ